MDDRTLELSPYGTQIDDLPSCLIIDILLRLPKASLLGCITVCRSWYLIFSDPLFVKLHIARSPTYLLRVNYGKPMKYYTSYGRILVPGVMSSEASASPANNMVCLCINSSNGLLFLQNYDSPLESYGSHDEFYVCNPILGQYITIKTGNAEVVKCCLGFSSRSDQFKVLQLTYPCRARIYTIGDGTGKWKSMGSFPSCPNFKFGCSLNGSIHWVDLLKTRRIFYFNFDSEQFGSFPSPTPVPVRRDKNWHATVGALDGCLFFYAGSRPGPHSMGKMDCWIMEEYGVQESWTKILSISVECRQLLSSLYKELSLLYEKCKIQLGDYGTTYDPSFISLQDVAKGEQLTLVS